MPRKIRPTMAEKLLPLLSDPIDAYDLARQAKSTFTGCESALKGMQRRGLVRKIVRREGGKFIAHQYQAITQQADA